MIKQIRIKIIFFIIISSNIGCHEEQTFEKLLDKKQLEIIQIDQKYFKDNFDIDQLYLSPIVLKKHKDLTLTTSSRWLSEKLIDTNDVLNFVLPHFVNNALDPNWRIAAQQMLSQYDLIQNNISKAQTIEICNQINNILKARFSFGLSNEDESFFSYSDYNLIKKGTCIAMSDFANYTFRAFGIPVTTDFTPTWGNLNSSGHAWNALLLKSGSKPFMGGETNVNSYEPLSLSHSKDRKLLTLKIPPKVYRISRYDKNNQLFFGKYVIDVTENYIEVNDITFENKSKIKNVYLSTFNNGNYIINSVGKNVKNGYLFNKMAIDLLYFPVKIYDSKTIPIGYPIVNTTKGNIIKKPNFNSRTAIKIDYLESINQAQLNHLLSHGYDDIEKIEFHDKLKMCKQPIPNEVYELYYWDFEWKIISKKKCQKNGLYFKNVPTNAVYAIKKVGSGINSTRPFIITDKKINWL